jgi:hypothetical protein
VLSRHFPSFRLNRPQFPANWQDDIITCAHFFNQWHDLDGSSITSRERDFGVTESFTVGIVSGNVVSQELTWLMDLYRTTFLDAVNDLGIGKYTTAMDERTAVNINSIEPGGRYEWHIDTNHLTVLLFVTSHAPGCGGELVFRPDPRLETSSWECVVTPLSGDLLAFDARRSAHSVLKLDDDKLRITVPMNYYRLDEPVHRPADLDTYLYG